MKTKITQTKHITTRAIACCALLAAISIVMARLLSYAPFGSVRWSLDKFPLFLAGMLFGPVAGCLTGFVADAAGSMMQYGFNPLLCPPAVLFGLCGGLFRCWMAKKPLFPKLIVSYLVPVVLGALRELCRRAQPMHVPRGDLKLLAAAQKARETFCRQHGREPTLQELAQCADADAQRLGEALAARERMMTLCSEPDWSTAKAEEGFEDWVLLRHAIRSLPGPYVQVLWLRCVAGLSQQQTAERLGVGQPQISRWEKRGKELLKEALE